MAEAAHVRLDFRSLTCIDNTGELDSDEVAIIVATIKPNQKVSKVVYPLGGDHYGDIDPGDTVFDPRNRIILWQGLLGVSQVVESVVTILEKDSGQSIEVVAEKIAKNLAKKAPRILEGDPVAVINVVEDAIGSLFDNVFGAGGHDLVGLFRLRAENKSGRIFAEVVGQKHCAVKGYGNEPAVSDSGKTLRLRVGNGDPQDYLAEIQVRDLAGDDSDDGVAISPWEKHGPDVGKVGQRA